MSVEMDGDQRTGFFLAAAAFVFWGLTPFYFKAMSAVSPLEIVSHRIIWSTFILAGLLLIINRKFFKSAISLLKRNGWTLGIGAVLLTINWLTYIYAVVNERVLEASLGYFINPLVNVALAAIILKEKLSRIQMFAVLLATIGVTQEIFRFGQFPTLAIIMAGTFGTYGLIRKRANIGGSEGLLIETLLLLPFAVAYLIYLSRHEGLAFLNHGSLTTGLAVVGGAGHHAAAHLVYQRHKKTQLFHCGHDAVHRTDNDGRIGLLDLQGKFPKGETGYLFTGLVRTPAGGH